jgi:hypothetical protein
MDTASIAGASLLMKTAQTQQGMSISMMKQAADQQLMMANMLEQNAKQAPQPSAQTEFAFSTYA